VGEEVLFQIVVRNTGNVPLDEVQIADHYPWAFLRPVKASQNCQIVNEQLVWTVDRILPSHAVMKEVLCKCVDAHRKACNRVTVTTRGGLRSTDEACIEILLPPAPREAEPDDRDEGQLPEVIRPGQPDQGQQTEPAEDETPVSGELQVSVVSFDNPVRVGEKSKFFVRVTNDRKVSDRNIQITCFLPKAVTLDRLQAPLTPLSSGADGHTLKLQPFAELRPGGKIDITVTVVARKTGAHPFRVDVSSLRTREPVSVEKELTINVE
jgi:hypothetical protein